MFLAATFCFPATYSSAATLSSVVDATENAKVLAGIQYITGQHAKRCGDFNTDPVTISKDSVETGNIIQLLSNPTRVSKQEADEDQKRVIATSVMATVFVHGGTKRLNRNRLEESHRLYRHFRALELIEDLSVESSNHLKADYLKDNVESLNTFLSSNWETYRDLETYSKITKELFALWFNEALEKHHDGFVKLVAIAEVKKQQLITEQVRQDKIKAAAEEEKQRLIKLEAEDAARKAKEKQEAAELAERLEQETIKAAAKAPESPQSATGSNADETGGNAHFATPKKKLNSNPEIQTLSKRLKAAAERTAQHENAHPLNASIDGVNFEFSYFKVSDDLNDTNYLGLGMTRSDFEARISSAKKEEIADIYQEMIASEIEGDAEGSGVTTKGASVTEAQIIEAFANYYLGSGQLVLASKLLAETSICIWKEKNGACMLESVYSNGEILSEINLLSSMQKRIKKMDAGLVHLYHTADDFYDSLQLIIEKKKANVALSSNSAVVRTSYFSNPTVQLRLATGVGMMAILSTFVFTKVTPGMLTNMMQFGSKFIPGMFRGLFKK